jgi:F420-0:gamma-glutamyl ligase
MGVSVMGEANESTPAAVVRGMKTIPTERNLSWHDLAVDAEKDIYRRGFLERNS